MKSIGNGQKFRYFELPIDFVTSQRSLLKVETLDSGFPRYRQREPRNIEARNTEPRNIEGVEKTPSPL